MKVSLIIPTYNEEKSIKDCLESLDGQSFKDFEVILVDDGSYDGTVEVVKTVHGSRFTVNLLQQKHKGPGVARNLGASKARGEILVFVDADMTFDKDFIKNLIQPILDKKCIGTFSKDELVANKGNYWSKCWNVNKNLPTDRMHQKNYPDEQPVFRAILKKEFEKAGGFKPIGYVDDYTIADALGVKAITAQDAIFYHKNPENLAEIWSQARWVGKSEYKRRKINNENLMRLIQMVRYSLPFSIINGVKSGIKNNLIGFIWFKIIYDLAIEISLLGSFFGEQQYK